MNRNLINIDVSIHAKYLGKKVCEDKKAIHFPLHSGNNIKIATHA